MHFAGVSVPTTFSQVLVHHQSIFPSFLPEDAHNKSAPQTSCRRGGDGGVKISLRTGVPELIVALDAAPELYTVLYTIVVCGVDFGNHVPHRFRREVVVSQK